MNISEDFKALEGHFDFDPEIEHIFFAGGYAKRMKVPRGYKVVGHRHKEPHKSVYIGGPVLLKTDDAAEILPFPCGSVNIPAHVHHEVNALGEVIWFCIWETEETDPEKIDESVIERV